MKKVIRLTESDIHNIVMESVKRVIRENDEKPVLPGDPYTHTSQDASEELEEGWFGDKWNQTKSAVNTAFGDSGQSFGKRFQNARKNWSTQGELNNMTNLQNQLMQMLDARQISPQTTVAQLVGGKYNNNKFGTMTGMAANRRAQISRRGGAAY